VAPSEKQAASGENKPQSVVSGETAVPNIGDNEDGEND
jgi:hypothetical protein